ncbi:MAG TPA: Maf family protein [Streptosporangiaceae bacterium]|nr:Maf family protein [Streptosporangiaceae bacterium]
MAPEAVPALVLASGSRGRLRLLRDAGFDPEVIVSGVAETNDDGLATADLVTALAERKAAAVAALRPGALVLGCDSLLDLDGDSLGKPATQQDAIAVWKRLAGSEGTLYTGHCLIHGPASRRAIGAAATTIRFGNPTDAEIAAYAATGEPLSLAGAFSIDGRAAAFVDGIDGDAGNVIGVSLPLMRRLLADVGVAVTDLWRPADTAS